MSDFYTITVYPVGFPVTLQEAKDFMRVTSTAEDDLIQAYIETATEQLESYTGQYFIERTVNGDFSNFLVAYKTEIYPFVKLRRAPLKSVTSVQVSSGGSFIDQDFQIKKHNHGFSRILFPSFDTSLDDIPYPLQIVFVAGYGDSDAVPERIKTAIKEYVNFLYRNRGDCLDPGACGVLNQSGGIPPQIKALVSSYRIIEVFA